MIHIDLTIEDVDYDSLIDRFLPLFIDKLRESDNSVSRLLSGTMPLGLAKTVLHKLSRDKKERMATELINKNSAKMIEMAEDYARQNGININIGRISATS